MIPIHVLISLHRGYGLGDAVQISAVLHHVVKARPEWVIDFQAEERHHTVGQGIVHNAFAYGQPYPTSHYDAEVQILLYDTFYNWHDRPNTRVSSCLHERFGLDWDVGCGRYQVNVSNESSDAAETLLQGGVGCKGHRSDKFVAVHYQGYSSQVNKNLTHTQAIDICQAVKQLGREPIVLDWHNRSPLPFRKITTPSAWGKDAEMVCAVIDQCEAFVGIDSGPAKCASATETPALVVWTRHHPAVFHDPAPNTTHLVPVGYHNLEPVCDNLGVIEFFEANYNVRQYTGDPVKEIERWLTEVLQ